MTKNIVRGDVYTKKNDLDLAIDKVNYFPKNDFYADPLSQTVPVHFSNSIFNESYLTNPFKQFFGLPNDQIEVKETKPFLSNLKNTSVEDKPKLVNIDEPFKLESISKNKFNFPFFADKNNTNIHKTDLPNSINLVKPSHKLKQPSFELDSFVKKTDNIKPVYNFKKFLDDSNNFSQDLSTAYDINSSDNKLITNFDGSFSSKLNKASKEIKNMVHNFLTRDFKPANTSYSDNLKFDSQDNKHIGGLSLEDNSAKIFYNNESLKNSSDKFNLLAQANDDTLNPFYTISDTANSQSSVNKPTKLNAYTSHVQSGLATKDDNLLQFVTGLSENNSYLKRAKNLYSHYKLIKSQKEIKGEKYTPEDFIKTHYSLHSPKTLRDAFALLNFPHELQYRVDKKYFSTANVYPTNNLSTNGSFSVLYNYLSSSPKIKNLIKPKIVDQKLEKKDTDSMLTFSKDSYSNSLTKFENHLLSLFGMFVSYASSNYVVDASLNCSMDNSSLECCQGNAIYMLVPLFKEVKPSNNCLGVDLSTKYD